MKKIKTLLQQKLQNIKVTTKSTNVLDNSQNADDIAVNGLTVGNDIADGIVVVVWLDRQMCIAQVIVSIPVSVWLDGTTTLIDTQLTHTSNIDHTYTHDNTRNSNMHMFHY